MLLEAKELDPGRTLRAEVAVVGAGACGITLARELAAAGRDVVLLEGGGRQYEEESQALYQGSAAGTCLAPDDAYLTSTRLRYLGGTTNHWAGWCRPLDPMDFERRDWLEHSGWPFDRAALDPYYRRAEELLELLPFAGAEDPDFGAWSLFDGSDLVVKRLFHMSPPVRFRVKYESELAGSERVRLVLHANVLRIRLAADGRRVMALEAASSPERRFTVEPRQVVLAMGGIETPRLLLASDDVHGAGIGNGSDLVGRFFMDHPHRRLGQALLWRLPESPRDFRSPKQPRQDRQPTLGLAEEYRRRHGLPGATVQVLAQARAGQEDPLVDTFESLQRLHRPDETFGRPPVSAVLNLRSEHSPNPDSRVTLDRERDRFGVPRARLDWRLREQDLRTQTAIAEVLAAELARLGIGRVRSEIEPHDPWTGTVGGAHHLGTTRMAADRSRGVVDPDCRVFGVENLYVAGGSTFPTCGYANPTLTIVALTLRLAEHLVRRLERGA